MIPEIIKNFIEVFSKLPSIGPRQASRLGFYIANLDPSSLNAIEKAINGFKFLNRCERCFFLKEKNKKLCSICANPNRNPQIVAIVEKETDLISLEKTGAFKGHYLVLGALAEKGVLEAMPKLRLQSLKNRIQKDFGGKIKEIIIALNQTTYGDFTANLIKEQFRHLSEKITRLGRGIPTGGEIEFADEDTLKAAFERRT